MAQKNGLVFVVKNTVNGRIICIVFIHIDAYKTCAIHKSIRSDACNTCRNRDLGERLTVSKQTAFNACDTVGDRNFGKSRAVCKCTFTEAGDRVGKGDLCQGGTAVECTNINVRDTVGECNSGKRSTVGKRHHADSRNTVRNRNTLKSRAVGKGIIADARNTVFNDGSFDVGSIFKPRGNIIFHHCTRSAYGQNAVCGQNPVYVVTVGAEGDRIGRNFTRTAPYVERIAVGLGKGLCRGTGITENNGRGGNARIAHFAIGIEDDYLFNITVIKCPFAECGNCGIRRERSTRQAEIHDGLGLIVQNAVFSGQRRVVSIHDDLGDTAVFECIVCNGRYVFGDGDAFKIDAVLECEAVDRGETVRQVDVGKRITAVECVFVDGCQFAVFTERNTRKICTVVKRSFADGGHTVGNGDGGQRSTIAECVRCDQCCSLFDGIRTRKRGVCTDKIGAYVQNAVFPIGFIFIIRRIVERCCMDARNAFGKRNIRKSRTAGKCIVSDARYTVGNRNGCKSRTIAKCTCPDTRYTVGNRNGCKSRTIAKCIIPNACYTVTDADTFKRGAVVEHKVTDGRYAVGDCDLRKSRTFVKCTLTDARYAVFDRNVGKILALEKCIFTDARYATRDRNFRKCR